MVKHALATVYMSGNEWRRVRGHARNTAFEDIPATAFSRVISSAVSLGSDVRAIGILCAIGIRNFLHDAGAAVAKTRAPD